jgi:uncharacterized protein YecT (DUF1311 family)
MNRITLAFMIALAMLPNPALTQTAEDSAAIEGCLKIANARREEANNIVADGTAFKTGAEAHLDRAGSTALYAAESCIGIVADPCLQTDEGSSTYGMLACIGRELDVWDKRLNTAYKNAIAPEADLGMNKNQTDIQIQQYRKIQRSWIPWRDATCEVLHADGIPLYGSDSRVTGAYCHLQLTAEQALRLSGELSNGNEF